MNAKERREAILARLKGETGPVSATVLAKEHGVSRQIVVGDIALLRASGEPISATPGGMCWTGSRRVCCTRWRCGTRTGTWSGSC